MNAPSLPADVEMPSLESAVPNAAPVPWRQFRLSPLAPLAGWSWGESKLEPYRKQTADPETSKRTRSMARLRRMRRGAPTVLLWGLLWYIVLQLVPLLLKDRWQSIGTALEARKWPALQRLVAEDPKRPLVVMQGSSRTCWAFRAGKLDGMADSDGQPLRVFNYGIPGAGPIYQLLYLQDMLAEGIRPRFLLIEFLPPLLCDSRRGTLTEERMTRFEELSVHRMRQWVPHLRRRSARLGSWLQGHLAPWYSFRRQILLEVQCLAMGKPFPRHDPVDEWGWRIASPMPFSIFERMHGLKMTRAGYATSLSHFRLGKRPTKALRELLDLCRREKIPAALVVMPESSQFRSWYSVEGRRVIRGLLDELTRTYDVEVIDANRWLPDDDFEDGQHTLLHGAESFTSGLSAELPRLLEQSKNAKSD